MAKNQIASPGNDLTVRQKNLLFAVIKEYCETGQNVGSKEIKEKYGFNFSSATIRNEFFKLRNLGYLFQPFTNASSQPTEKSFKLFINQLIAGLQVTTKRQKELQSELLKMQNKQAKLDKEISRLLALEGGGVGFAVSKSTENYSGIKNLLEKPSEGKVADILDFLENLDNYKQPLLESEELVNNNFEINVDDEEEETNKRPKTKQAKEKNIKAYFGSENPVLPLGRGFAMVATEVFMQDEKSVVGLIAPTHLLAQKKSLELIEALSEVLKNQEEH